MTSSIWYVARVRPQREIAATRAMAALDVVAAAPCERLQIRDPRAKGGRKWVQRPILTGYLLLAYDASPAWHGYVNSLEWPDVGGRIVQAWCGASGQPTPILHSEVDHLFRMIDAPPPTPPRLEPGMVARILDGALVGSELRIERIEGRYADLLWPGGRVRVPTKHLEKAS